jgi:hypothetical protein
VQIPEVKARALRRSSRSTANPANAIENRLKQIAIAMHQYYDVNKSFPVRPSRKWFDEENRPYLSWRVHLLPFLEEDALYRQFKLDEPWDSPHNAALLEHMPEIYRSSPREKHETRFAVVVGPHTIFGREMPMGLHQMTDGTSNTILVVQTPPSQLIPWTKPEDLTVDLEHPRRAWGRSTSRGIFCVLADASTLQLPGTVPDEMLSALLTGQGREVIDAGTVRRYSAYRRGEMFVPPDRAHEHEQRKLKEIGIALQNYHDSRKQFPPAGPLTEQPNQRGVQLSWRVHILPYLELRNLYEQFHLDEPWDSPHNLELAKHMPDIYRDADDPVDSMTTRIVFMTGPNTPFVDRRRGPQFRQFRDGTSKTILAVQAGDESAVVWTKPDDLPFDPRNPVAGLGSVNPRVGLLVLMADGSIRTLSPGFEDATFAKLVTPDGGEIVDVNQLDGRSL